jgi:chromosome partitioning protein
MRTIAITNNKGGSGKTTTTVSLASAFAERGLRILVVDLDPQGSATTWLGGREAAIGLSEYAAGGIQVPNLVMTTTAPGVDLIPTTPSLVPPDDRSRTDAGLALIRGFARLPSYWDLVLIDTPPTVGYLSLAALVASDWVVIPVEPSALGMPGVASVIDSIGRARLHVNRKLKLLGIVICRVKATNHTREVVERLRTEFGAAVLEQSVREAVRIAEAPALRQPITVYAPKSPVANEYRAVAAELLERLGDLSDGD